MKNKNIIILVVSIVLVILLIVTGLFIGIPMYLKTQARSVIKDTVTNESVTTKLEEQEKEMFNSQFTAYQTNGEETTSATKVLMMFSYVAANNDEEDSRKVDINGTTITKNNIEELKKCVSSELLYKIKCIYDDDGYVKTIELKYTN